MREMIPHFEPSSLLPGGGKTKAEGSAGTENCFGL